MSHNTYLIICAILIVFPFVVSCIKGSPGIGLLTGIASFLAMGFVANQGAPTLGILLCGFFVSGLGTAHSLNSYY